MKGFFKRSVAILLSLALLLACAGQGSLVLAGPTSAPETAPRIGATGVTQVPSRFGQSGTMSLAPLGGISAGLNNGVGLGRALGAASQTGIGQQAVAESASREAVGTQVPAYAQETGALAAVADAGNVLSAGKKEADGAGANPLTLQAQQNLDGLSQSGPIQAAVGKNAGDQLAGLSQLYSAGVAPASSGGEIVDFLPNGDGPSIFHFIYDPKRSDLQQQPEGVPPAEFMAGRTPVYIAPGTGYSDVAAFDRAFVRRHLLQAAEYLQGSVPGLTLVFLDKAKNKPPEVQGFVADDRVAGNIEDTSILRSIAANVVEAVRGLNGVIIGASTVLNPYISFPPVLQELVQSSGMNPYILVNPYETVRSAQVKSTFRQKVAEYAPWMKLPSRVLDYPEAEFGSVLGAAKAANLPIGKDPESIRVKDAWWREVAVALMRPAVERMLPIYREMQAESPGRHFVMKPEKSAGKAAIRDDIGSEEAVIEAYLGIFKEILFTWSGENNAAARSSFTLPEKANLVLERQIKGHGEYDTELVIRRMANGMIEVLAFVIGNPLLVPITKSEVGMTFPALLSKELALALIRDAVESVLAVWHPLLPFGNFHVEMMLDGGTTPFPIEVNATRPLGGNHGVPMVLEWSGVDLVREGMLAALGLPLTPLAGQPKRALSLKKPAPTASGYLREFFIPPALLGNMPGYIRVYRPNTNPEDPQTWLGVSDPRDPVAGAVFGGAGNVYIAAWSDEGQLPEQANQRAFDAMSQMEFVIRADKNDPATEVRLPARNEFHPDDAELRFPRPQ